MNGVIGGAFAVSVVALVISIAQWFAFMPLRRRIKEAKRSAAIKERFDLAGKCQQEQDD